MCENIKYIKMIMMFMVVLFHSCLFYSGTWFTVLNPEKELPYVVSFANFLNCFQTQAFTMASGYLFFYLRYEKGKYRNAKRDLLKRSGRLLVPYFIIVFLWAIPFRIIFYGVNISQIIDKFILGFSPDQLWFLLMLFWVYLVFYFISDRIKFEYKYSVLFICISIIGSLFSSIKFFNFLQISTAVRYLLFYYMGGYFYKTKVKFNLRKIIIWGCIGIFLWWIWEITRTSDILIIKIFNSAFKSIVSGCMVTVIYMIATTLSEKTEVGSRLKAVLDKISKDSFGIYLFHQQLIYVFIWLLNGKVSPLCLIVYTYIGVLIISDIIVTILKNSKRISNILGI